MPKKVRTADESIRMPASYTTRPCGPVDRSAKFPEPAHYDCKSCAKVIHALLLARHQDGR
jgi:hypothetical protein